MALIDDVLNYIYYILMIPVFIVGFNMARKGLVKVNKIEGEKFRLFDWLVSIMFGLLFSVAVVFCINLAIDFLTPETGITIPPVGSFLLLIALGVLIIYPFWEMFYLARPTSDSVTDYHRFLESHFIDKVHGRKAYLVSLMLLIVTYGLPIFLLTLTSWMNLLQALFLWVILVPLIFLNYFAAAGTVSNVIKINFMTNASNRVYPGIKAFQNPISKLIALIKLVIAIVPLILAAYGLYSSISAAFKGGAEAKSGPTVYLSLFTTVVFGILGFFSRFWKKKSKTKSIDFLFAGYIMIAIMMNILINFMTLNASQVISLFNVNIPGIGPAIQSIGTMLQDPAFTLPIITLQNFITVIYAIVILFQVSSDFQSNIRLGAVSYAYNLVTEKQLMKLNKLAKKLKSQGKSDKDILQKLKIKKPDHITLLKSIVLAPRFNKYGVDINEEIRAKASQYIGLIVQQSKTKDDITKISDFLHGHTINKPTSGKNAFLSPEAFECVGVIGTKYPDLELNPLLNKIGDTNLLRKQYILNALGMMGAKEGNVKVILEKDDIRKSLNDPSYEVKNAAVLSIAEIGLELDDVGPVLEQLYPMMDDVVRNSPPLGEYLAETLLQSILKVSVKEPTLVNIEKVIPFLDFNPENADEDTLNFVLQYAIRIIAYLVHYAKGNVPVDRLFELAKDKRAFIRHVTFDALGNLILNDPRPDIIRLLVLRSLGDPDPDVRAMCNESIAEYCIHTEGESESVIINGTPVKLLDFYLEKLNAKDAFIAENASEALKSLAREFSNDIYKQLEPSIAGENEELVRDCSNVLSTLSPQVQASIDLTLLYKRLDETSDKTRAEIIKALGYIGLSRKDVDVARIKKYMTRDADPEVLFNSIFALGKIGTMQPAVASDLLIDYLDQMNKSERSLELELLFEALGVIGKKHPYNTIIEAIDRGLLGDTNPFSKDVVAKALKSIGEGLIDRIVSKQEPPAGESRKMTYLPGNIVMIFLNALQQKGLPASVIDIISDGIQDLLPYFLIADKSKTRFEYLDTLLSFLIQAYNSNFSHEIIETIDRIKSLKSFSLYVDDESVDLVKSSSKLYAKQYTPDGKQFYDQGMFFIALGNDKHAMASFEIALELSPNEFYSPRCHLEMSKIHLRMGDIEDAKKQINIAKYIFAFFDDIAGLTECETVEKQFPSK